MPFLFRFKSTVLCLSMVLIACGQEKNKVKTTTQTVVAPIAKEIVVAANRTDRYLPLLKNKNIAVVANQTSVVFKPNKTTVHLVDTLISSGIKISKVFAPEHGFRGNVDAGEMVKNGIDDKTGLPLISLYGKNKKPTKEQLANIDLVLFDIQDVGVRFYTYIATLQLVMEACADTNIPVLVLDRPNPNAHYVDGPTMEAEHTSFLGMTQIPLVYGMTIGEYANMINEEGWLSSSKKANLTIVKLENYTHDTPYNLAIRPSPNLPNNTAINLYPSLGLFEGTTVNAGRGTEAQFQRFGASFLDSTKFFFKYTPAPNFGSKNPKENGKLCYGMDLSNIPKMNRVTIKWIKTAYDNALNKKAFFMTNSFTKHAGNTTLQQQIIDGISAEEIEASWQPGVRAFKAIRNKYLIYD
ncbi:exo-beta-N-acetylmuramidase NamZ family protein [Croceivirga radicis]|uniref:exo-beta-N-acetylmuramidase NamZ family protein n=1 Tax=Croceivirga radicis TaxID=1929488 RepID=UPI0004977F18|nr:DUF1343 domain-containing protein [Croceivirga radicis]